MSTHQDHDTLVSVRVAADLCGIPTARVQAMLSNKRAIREGERHEPS